MYYYEVDIVKELGLKNQPYDIDDAIKLKVLTKIEYIEDDYDMIHLRFPDNYELISPEFFNTFMKDSFKKAGSKKSFLEKYSLLIKKKSSGFIEHTTNLINNLELEKEVL